MSLVLRNASNQSDDLANEEIKATFELLIKLVDTYDTYELEDCIWGIYHLCKKENNIQQAIDLDIFNCIERHLYKPNLLQASLKAFSAIVAGNEQHTDYIIKQGVLDIFNVYIDTESIENLKNIIVSVANIATSTEEHIILLTHHEIFPAALRKLCHNNAEIRLETSFLLKNFFCQASIKEKLHAIEFDIYTTLAESLGFNESEYLFNVLASVYKILELNTENSNIIRIFYESGCLVQLQNLYSHPEPEVSQCASIIYAAFFESSQEDYLN